MLSFLHCNRTNNLFQWKHVGQELLFCTLTEDLIHLHFPMVTSLVLLPRIRFWQKTLLPRHWTCRVADEFTTSRIFADWSDSEQIMNIQDSLQVLQALPAFGRSMIKIAKWRLFSTSTKEHAFFFFAINHAFSTFGAAIISENIHSSNQKLFDECWIHRYQIMVSGFFHAYFKQRSFQHWVQIVTRRENSEIVGQI